MVTPISVDNTYIYTNDLANFTGAGLTARTTLQDTNGGIDTLNLAAVTAASIVDLAAGTGTIAGKEITIASGTVIENIYGGDGNDILTGNAVANYIFGGRGDDRLQGMGGNDTLDGGMGSDIAVFASAVSDYALSFIDATHLTALDAVGGLGLDTLINIESFVFSGVAYSLADLMALPAYSTPVVVTPPVVIPPDPVVSTPSPPSAPTMAITDIGLDFTWARTGHFSYHSDTTESHTITATDMNYYGPADLIRVDHDSTGFALHFLNAQIPPTMTITGSAGDEIITLDGVVNKSSLSIDAGAGNDTVTLNLAESATIHGGVGNDTITGHNGNDILYGDNDNDILYGGGGDDKLDGGAGNDILHSGTGSDVLYGGAGNDTLYSDNGGTTLYGGDGADIFAVGAIGTYAASIKDFAPATGDKIDISAVLESYDPLTQSISDFVHATTSGTNGILSIDADGAANGAHFTAVLSVAGTAHLDIAAMIAQGTLIV